MRGISIVKKISVYFLIFSLLLTSILFSNSFSTEVKAASLLSDDFESYSTFPSGGWATAVSTGSWTLATDGTKVAKNNVSSTGTYLLTNGNSAWTNYTFSADVKPGSVGTRHGIVFRYVDTSNYYYLVFKDGSKVYLYKKVSGSESAIAYGNFTYNSSTFYNMKVTVNGSAITCYVNGTQVLSGSDSTLSAGKVALFSFGNASFDNVAIDDGSAATPTPTATATPTPTPTSTPTPTPTSTPTPTPTSTPSNGTTYEITSASQFSTVFASAQPGDTLLVSCNLGSISLKGKAASSANPITIKAKTTLGYSITSATIDSSTGIILEGFKFGPNSSATYLKITNNCQDIKITRNFFDSTGITGSQTSLQTTQYNNNIEISYNQFDGKQSQQDAYSGSYVKLGYSGAGLIAKNVWIHHNSFKNILPVPSGSTFDGDSDREAIVFGISGSQDEITNNIVEYNYFEDCDGENEIITVKTSQNIIRYNTFKNCLGSVSVRFGTKTEVYGNYFFADSSNKSPYAGDTGGVRVYGSYHKIYNNYFQGLTGTGLRSPILIDGGDTTDSTGGDSHERASYCEATNNTIVNCAAGIELGRSYTIAPVSNKIANNIVENSTGNLLYVTKESGTTFEGNILNCLGSASIGGTYTQAQAWATDPLLTSATLNGYSINKLVSGSPAINYAKGTYSYVTTDMEGQTRSTNDAGSDEYSTASATKYPLCESDVGCSAN